TQGARVPRRPAGPRARRGRRGGDDEAGRGVPGLPELLALPLPGGLAPRVLIPRSPGLEFDAVAGPLAEIADSFFTPAVNDLVPYEPGKPVEEVQRELGLERVVKLAPNQGPYGPFPEAREAIGRCVGELNRH